MKNFCLIGLTGQSGAGKTTVSDVFKDNGFYIINADDISRSVTKDNKACVKEVLKAFPECNKNDIIDRKILASIVFNNKSELEKLMSITFKYITEDISDIINCTNAEFYLLDAPTLFESGLNLKCDFIISVISSREQRLLRIKIRDNLDEKSANERLNAAKSDEFFKSNSDFILENNKTKEELFNSALVMLNKIKEIYNGKKEK